MGKTEAMRVYGMIFAKGFGVTKNSTEAARYKMAIDKGNVNEMEFNRIYQKQLVIIKWQLIKKLQVQCLITLIC